MRSAMPTNWRDLSPVVSANCGSESLTWRFCGGTPNERDMMAMTEVTVRGASDDLIEVEGPKWGDEFAGGDEPKWLHFSDGTILKVWYGDEGIWKVDPIKIGNGTDCKMKICIEETAEVYSDVATLTGDIKSVTVCSSVNGMTRDDMLEVLQQWEGCNEWDDLKDKTLQTIIQVIEAD